MVGFYGLQDQVDDGVGDLAGAPGAVSPVPVHQRVAHAEDETHVEAGVDGGVDLAGGLRLPHDLHQPLLVSAALVERPPLHFAVAPHPEQERDLGEIPQLGGDRAADDVLHPFPGGALPGPRLAEDGRTAYDGPAPVVVEELLLVGDVVVERRLRDVGRPGDVLHPRRVVAPGREDRDGDVGEGVDVVGRPDGSRDAGHGDNLPDRRLQRVVPALPLGHNICHPMVMTRPFDEVDVSTYSFWELGATERDDRFAILREKRPVSWQRPAEGMATLPGIEGAGYWAVLRHADVMTVSRDPETYCSSRGYMIEDIPMEILEPAGSFLGMDHPRHTQLRRLVSLAFSPRRVRLLEDKIAARPRRLVDDLPQRGGGDFVEVVSKPLPSVTFAEMMGVDEEDRE